MMQTTRHTETLLRLAILLLLSFVAVGTATGQKRVTDPIGRSITVPDNPRRIISLAPSITEIIFDLGQQNRLVGVTRYSTYPPAAAKLPRVGTYVRLDLERILALQPDLCLAVKDGNPIAAIRRLGDLGIPVYALDPRDMAAIMETIRSLGELLDARQAAEALLSDMESRINRIRLRLQRAGSRPRVFLQIGISPMVSVGPNTLGDELIRLAGGINVVSGDAPYPVLSREQILALAPEVYIITSMDREMAFEKTREEWRQWSQMPAVRNQRMHLINSDLTDRPSPRLVDGLECIAALVHPDLFEFNPQRCQEFQ